ncbi:hypothetical protein SAMN05428997_13220 [Bosea sp. CRIB-10]|uniref:hypothetical protein n=1 Tax=Bosea sp. CRIB-10 TaxID=378404 RepID=UPI0008ED992A|nr:hypothetical protein [Bosea sp. CRIB-10]SFD54400.1 hypothetical protein SAMN05428997_13220 [Bosea sp. CRIB-10]
MSMQTPTRTATTEKRYLKRFGELWRASDELGRTIGVMDLVRRFLAWSLDLRPNSVRRHRSAIQFGLDRLEKREPHLRADVIETLTLLDSSRQQEPGLTPFRKTKLVAPLRTSSNKAKAVSDQDFDRNIAAAPLYRSQYSDDLVGSMRANILPGLRPIDWHGTRITITAGTLVMIVSNGKNTNDRSHGESRTLIFEAIDPVSREHLVAWAERVNRLTLEAYETLLTRIEERMRQIAKSLFPRRKRRPRHAPDNAAGTCRWR